MALQVNATKMLFVTCHLAAHEGVDKCEIRNKSCFSILEAIRERLTDGQSDISAQFHHIFWMGDMNYRTTFETVLPKAMSNINVHDFEASSPVHRYGPLNSIALSPSFMSRHYNLEYDENGSESDSEFRDSDMTENLER